MDKKGIKRSGKMKAAALALILSLTVSGTVFGAGWQQTSEGWRYQNEDGTWFTNGFTPDGYYIDGSGIWTEKEVILGVTLPGRNEFLTASMAGSLTGWEQDLKKAMETIVKEKGNIRSFTLEDGRVTSYGLTKDGERELFSFYKSAEDDGYVLRLKCALTKSVGRTPLSSWYDYQVLSLLFRKFSRTGGQLAEAVYSSWEEDNSYKLKNGQWVPAGDAFIRYEAADGAGFYYIKSRY